jgi:hypothetical protein
MVKSGWTFGIQILKSEPSKISSVAGFEMLNTPQNQGILSLPKTTDLLPEKDTVELRFI